MVAQTGRYLGREKPAGQRKFACYKKLTQRGIA
jgi:hypothetical protein